MTAVRLWAASVSVALFACNSSDFNGEAYATVSGQNSNNSVRVTDEFLQAVEQDGEWNLTARLDGKVKKTLKARELWEKITFGAWSCADPGLQFDTTINEWHTCPNTARIYASNPCSEYMFLNDSACNLASINLMKFVKDDGEFDAVAYKAAIRTLITAQEIIVDNASYPTPSIGKNSHDYRPLGLGYEVALADDDDVRLLELLFEDVGDLAGEGAALIQAEHAARAPQHEGLALAHRQQAGDMVDLGAGQHHRAHRRHAGVSCAGDRALDRGGDLGRHRDRRPAAGDLCDVLRR